MLDAAVAAAGRKRRPKNSGIDSAQCERTALWTIGRARVEVSISFSLACSLDNVAFEGG